MVLVLVLVLVLGHVLVGDIVLGGRIGVYECGECSSSWVFTCPAEAFVVVGEEECYDPHDNCCKRSC